jgi:hypothetical protein
MFARSISRSSVLATIAVLLLSIVGCNSNDTTVSGPAVADATMELVPTEGPTVASTDPDFDWMVSMELVLTEHGGDVGLEINEISVDMVEAQNGISLGSQDGDRWSLDANDPGTRVEAGESLTIDLDVFYSFESGGRESLLAVTVLLTDDNGTLMVGTETFNGLP